MRRLFESEVAEIADNTVELRGIAREAGYRTKVAVASNDDKVDPVGACVGLRGARVKNIVRELNNEKVDIIRWSDDPATFVVEALKPANIRTISLDKENKVVSVTVDEEELSKAIGRRGQNARLSAKLMGWDVQVSKDETQHEQFEARVGDAAHSLAVQLGLDDEMAEKLFRAGGATADLVAQMPAEYIAQALEVPVEQAAIILSKVVPAEPAAAAESPDPPAEAKVDEPETTSGDETKESEGAEA